MIEGEDPRTLAALFESTPFFKAVQVHLDDTILAKLRDADTKRFEDEQQFLSGFAAKTTVGRDDASESATSEREEQRLREIEPIWWNWRSPLPLMDRSSSPDELARRSQPRVLASFDLNHRPFVVERKIGAGRVLFFASGVTSNWNLLRSSGAMYLFHRVFCQLMEQTFPPRNFAAGQRITLPVESLLDRRYRVRRPSGITEPLVVDALSPTVSGITIRHPLTAGTYTIFAEELDDELSGGSADLFDEISFAVNGAETESEWMPFSNTELQRLLGEEEDVLSVDDIDPD